MSYHEALTQQWIRAAKAGEPPYNNAYAYGVSIQPLPAMEADTFKVIGVHHLSGSENRGNHHIFCDVLDHNGHRIGGSKLMLRNNFALETTATVDKPYYEPGTNFPMWSNYGAVSVSVMHKGIPSETATGMHIQHNDEEPGNTWGHHSFLIVWQLTKRRSPSLPPIVPPQPPTQPGTSLTWIATDSGEMAVDPDHFYIRFPRGDVQTALQIPEALRWLK